MYGDKALPIAGFEDNYITFNSKAKTGNIVSVSEVAHILAVMDIVDKEMPHIKNLVIDDLQYMSGFEFMKRIKERGFDKFNDIANNIFLVCQDKPSKMRKDLIVFYLNHEETQYDDSVIVKIKAKTCGKLIDNLITLEGLFTTVLRANKRRKDKEIEYFFETRTDGVSNAGTPKGMFDTAEIPNDLNLVREAIANYKTKKQVNK